MQHPYGVQPEHIAELTGDSNKVRKHGLGTLARLNDNLLLDVLGSLDASSLARCSTVSRVLHVFCNHEELWKSLVLTELHEKGWEFKGTWQDTYVSQASKGWRSSARTARKVERLYSDALHRPWFCANVEIDPEWLEADNIDRRSGLTIEEFRREYELPNRPVILTDIVPRWPAYKKWTHDYLHKALEGSSVMVGDAPMTFTSYCRYADSQKDEMPLYLFDKNFAKSVPSLADDYQVPDHFSEDLFAVLGEDERPDYRWLIIGPQKSGSTFHKVSAFRTFPFKFVLTTTRKKHTCATLCCLLCYVHTVCFSPLNLPLQDPNSTSAWNAVISGSKKWLLYPPHVLPPGVHTSVDGADVASPVSIMEWFLSFYSLRDAGGNIPCECTLTAGEILFVPRSWWHTALNLEETVAITQNFVGQANLKHVLSFLASPHADVLVSGVGSMEKRRTLHSRFVSALEEHKPHILEIVREEELRESEKKKVRYLHL